MNAMSLRLPSAGALGVVTSLFAHPELLLVVSDMSPS